MSVIPDIKEFITGELLQRTDLNLDNDIPLIEEGYLTSLQAVELILFIEERFQVEIDPMEVDEDNFRSLNSIGALVEGKMG